MDVVSNLSEHQIEENLVMDQHTVVIGNTNIAINDDAVPLEETRVALDSNESVMGEDPVAMSDPAVPIEDGGVSMDGEGVPMTDSTVTMEGATVHLSDGTVAIDNDTVTIQSGNVTIDTEGVMDVMGVISTDTSELAGASSLISPNSILQRTALSGTAVAVSTNSEDEDVMSKTNFEVRNRIVKPRRKRPMSGPPPIPNVFSTDIMPSPSPLTVYVKSPKSIDSASVESILSDEQVLQILKKHPGQSINIVRMPLEGESEPVQKASILFQKPPPVYNPLMHRRMYAKRKRKKKSPPSSVGDEEEVVQKTVTRSGRVSKPPSYRTAHYVRPEVKDVPASDSEQSDKEEEIEENPIEEKKDVEEGEEKSKDKEVTTAEEDARNEESTESTTNSKTWKKKSSIQAGPVRFKRGRGLKRIHTFKRGRGRSRVYHYRNTGFRTSSDELAKEVSRQVDEDSLTGGTVAKLAKIVNPWDYMLIRAHASSKEQKKSLFHDLLRDFRVILGNMRKLSGECLKSASSKTEDPDAAELEKLSDSVALALGQCKGQYTVRKPRASSLPKKVVDWIGENSDAFRNEEENPPTKVTSGPLQGMHIVDVTNQAPPVKRLRLAQKSKAQSTGPLQLPSEVTLPQFHTISTPQAIDHTHTIQVPGQLSPPSDTIQPLHSMHAVQTIQAVAQTIQSLQASQSLQEAAVSVSSTLGGTITLPTHAVSAPEATFEVPPQLASDPGPQLPSSLVPEGSVIMEMVDGTFMAQTPDGATMEIQAPENMTLEALGELLDSVSQVIDLPHVGGSEETRPTPVLVSGDGQMLAVHTSTSTDTANQAGVLQGLSKLSGNVQVRRTIELSKNKGRFQAPDP